jgi:cytidine deaminase
MHSAQVSPAIIQWCSLSELEPAEKELILRARDATRYSHSPYSNFCVGCAVRLRSNEIVNGSNQENASYGLACCAERTTIFTVNNAGKKHEIRALAVTGRPANAEPYYHGKVPVAPCGACRQVIKESEDLAGEPITILMDCFDDNKIGRLLGIAGLLPFAFGPADLGIDISEP